MSFLAKLISTVLVLVFSANAEAISWGPLSGQMKNHTGFETSDFEVEVIFQCHPPEVEFEYDKHTVTVATRVNADGTFTVPKMVLEAVDSPSYLNCTAETYYKVRKELARKYPGNTTLRVMNSGRDIYDGKVALEFTAIEIDENPMEYNVSSGISSEEFVNGMGKNFHLSLHYDFSKSFPKASGQFTQQAFYRWGNYFKNSIGVTSRGVIYLPGLHQTKDIPAEVKIRLASDLSFGDSEKVASIKLNGLMPLDLLNLDVELSKIFRPLSPMTGLWNKTKIYLGQPGALHQVYYDAKMKIECSGGLLTGALEPGTTAGSTFPTLLNKAHSLSGYCDGDETGEARLQLEYSDRSRKSVVFKFNRIASCFLVGSNGCLMSTSSPEPDFYNHPGAEYSTSLQLNESSGNSIGLIQIGISK